MNDPFSRNAQALTDLLLGLDRAISVAETNVAAAQQLGLPEAADLAARLPLLTDRARQFLANVPDMSLPQRWGDQRRLLDQARSFQPYFAPYLMLGTRVAAARQAIADQAARQRAMAEAMHRAQAEQQARTALDAARVRFSQVRQTYADMGLQRGQGFDDAEWQESVRSVGSILQAQDTRLSSAAACIRDGTFDQAQAQLDQALGELQAALDLAQRARVAAGMRAQAQRAAAATAGQTIPMPDLRARRAPPLAPPAADAAKTGEIAPTAPGARTLTLIEARTGTLFRCDGRPTMLGRGLDQPAQPGEVYLDLSRACDPGEAEYLGISRRHAEIARLGQGFVARDLGSTNGTRLRLAGQATWETLTPRQWTALHEGDAMQFGLLECTIALG